MTHTKPLPIAQLLMCGAAIVTLSMGTRHAFGLWLLPVIEANNWGRETFSFAAAVQNIAWEIGRAHV